MRPPGPLPTPPNYYSKGWASQFVQNMETFFASLKGEWVSDSKLVTRSGRILNVTVTTGTSYTILSTDDVVDVNSTQAFTLTLPSTARRGQRHQIQDSSGNAQATGITISAASTSVLVNASTYAVLASNYGRVTAIYNGTRWLLASG